MMNNPGQIAQTSCPGEGLDAHRRYDAGPFPDPTDAIDPTSDLANEATHELPDPGTRTITTLPAANDAETAGIGMARNERVVTAGTLLRERYILEQQLGKGGTATIFRARDLRRNAAIHDGSHVAIKVLLPEFRDRPHCIARLKREYRQTHSLAHPNIVRFYDLDCEFGTWFIAMEALAGETLGQRMRRASPQCQPMDEAMRIAAAYGDALAFAHEQGITHGDVKPDNLFITAADEVRVFDFGVAPESAARPPPADSPVAEPVSAAATRAYASPEVLSGQTPEPRDDVFSLACVIYEMLAGRHPYGRRGADEARDAHLEIESLPALSAMQWRALAAGLAWRREQRTADVRELLHALGSIEPCQSSVQAVVALPSSAIAGEVRWRSGRSWPAAVFVLFAIVIGGLVGRFAFDSRSAPLTVALNAPALAGIVRENASASRGEAAVGAVPVGDPETGRVRSAVPAFIPSSAQPTRHRGVVTFDVGSMVVSRHAVVAAIPIRRLDHAERSASIRWRIIEGTAKAARDYGGPRQGVVRFAANQLFRMIYVPILNEAQVAGDRSFTVELTGASADATPGATPRIKVTILADR